MLAPRRLAGWLALAILLALPALAALWSAVLDTAFLVEFLSDHRWRPLTALAPAPVRLPLLAGTPAREVPADLYERPALWRPPALVLVHGLSPLGKNDRRLRQAAVLLTRAGWTVAVPTVGGLTTLRLRPEDAETVTAAVEALADAGYPRAALLGISVGAGPALLAAAHPETAPRVSAVMALGGYASAVELLRYTLTGAYRFEGVEGRRPVDPEAIARFARANQDLLDSPGRRLVSNRDPGEFDRLAAELPPASRQLLDDLSPERIVGRLRAPLFLVHGRDDPAVPFTESLRLRHSAQAAGRESRLTIVGAVGHVEPEARAGLRDLARLWAAYYAFRARAERGAWGGITTWGG
ncbi:MAG TPA: hypothetical protein VFN71_04755 [Methylomirabilota bacterium]|nr:hypothetical protein [Methylomirabilota bacterium]